MSKIPKNLEWNQNDDFIFIKMCKLISISNSQVDTFISDTYIKLNLGTAFFYEFFFANEIVSDESVCKLFENCIKFKLKKKEKIFWNDLYSPINFSDKNKQITLKTAVFEENTKNIILNDERQRDERKNSQKKLRENEMKRQSDLRSKTKEINTDMKIMALKKVSLFCW